MPRFTIHDLAATIDARAASGGEVSYTRKLLDKGAEHCAKKLGEEAVETVIAAVENDRDHLIAESADLLFHLLVLLKARGVTQPSLVQFLPPWLVGCNPAKFGGDLRHVLGIEHAGGSRHHFRQSASS